MKKTLAIVGMCLFALMLSWNANAQQGSWAGLVKYKLTWSGNVPQGVPQEWETKVYKELEGGYDWSFLMLGGRYIANSQTKNVMLLLDFSQIPLDGIQGKWFIKNKMTEQDLKEATYEYTGQKKEIAGLSCEQVKCTFISKNDDGDTTRTELIYVTKEIGPKVNMYAYPGLDAFPMEYPIQLGEDLSVTLTASELLKNKVKEEDLMLETGYEEITTEDLQDMMQQLMKAMGGGDEDDM